MAADADPYTASAVMLGEAALALALDGPRLPGGGGVLTPATALGTDLADRLVAGRGQIYTRPAGGPPAAPPPRAAAHPAPAGRGRSRDLDRPGLRTAGRHPTRVSSSPVTGQGHDPETHVPGNVYARVPATRSRTRRAAATR